jgi:hypothetical protein
MTRAKVRPDVAELALGFIIKVGIMGAITARHAWGLKTIAFEPPSAGSALSANSV